MSRRLSIVIPSLDGAAMARGEILLFCTPTPVARRRAGLEPGERVWGRFDVRIEGRARMLRVVAATMNWRSRLTGIASGDQALFVTRAADLVHLPQDWPSLASPG